MGANGRAYILQNLTRERTAAKYELVPESVLNDAEMERRLQPQGARERGRTFRKTQVHW